MHLVKRDAIIVKITKRAKEAWYEEERGRKRGRERGREGGREEEEEEREPWKARIKELL